MGQIVIFEYFSRIFGRGILYSPKRKWDPTSGAE